MFRDVSYKGMLLGFDKVGFFIKHSSVPVSTGQRRMYWGQEEFQVKVDIGVSAAMCIYWVKE